MKTPSNPKPFLRWHSLLAALCLCAGASQSVHAQNVCATQASLVNPAVGSGIGGTGAPALDPGGIGGTGMLAGKPVFGEGGLGGTGIVGVITGFASICVNGIEVHYDANTPVWDNGKPGTIGQLAVGQVVAVTANENGAQPTARGISMIDALVGPVGAVDAATGHIQVLGQKVAALQTSDVAALKAGDWVRVSGFQTANGDIAATRVLALPAPTADASVQVRGPVTAINANTVKVGQTTIDVGKGGWCNRGRLLPNPRAVAWAVLIRWCSKAMYTKSQVATSAWALGHCNSIAMCKWWAVPKQILRSTAGCKCVAVWEQTNASP
jgi:Domain of unknown function (DUF5666)